MADRAARRDGELSGLTAAVSTKAFPSQRGFFVVDTIAGSFPSKVLKMSLSAWLLLSKRMQSSCASNSTIVAGSRLWRLATITLCRRKFQP